MKILYLTFFESVTHNGIYETQVKQLLCDLAMQNGTRMSVSHCALLPAVEIGRKAVTIDALHQRKELGDLRQQYTRCGVNASFLFLPMLVLRRWAQSLPVVVLAIAMALPVLLYKMLRQRPDIIHCRSYPSTLLALLLKVFFTDVKVVFDPRGFFAEEGVVTGKWKNGSFAFRVWKRLEKYLFMRSDKVVALSESFAERISTISKDADSVVIYACADIDQFSEARPNRDLKRRELGIEGRTVFVYNGSLHAWHDPRLLAQLFVAIRQQVDNAKLLVITRHNKAQVEKLFRDGGLFQDFLIVAAEPNDVPGYLSAGDYGVVPLREIGSDDAFRVVANTMIGLKVTEYLASGLPLIVNKDVRGIKPLLDHFKIGVFFDPCKMEEGIPTLGQMMLHRREYEADCLLVAHELLSLHQATKSYCQLYERLLQPSPEKGSNVCNSSSEKLVSRQDFISVKGAD